MSYKVEVTVRVTAPDGPYNVKTVAEAGGLQTVNDSDAVRILRGEVNRARDIASERLAGLIEAAQDAEAEAAFA